MSSLLAAVWACSSSYGPDPAPVDPALAAEARAERARLRAEREAEEAAQRAEQAELERAVQSIESSPGDPPPPLEQGEVSQLFLYYCGECHATDRQLSPSHDGMFGIEDLDIMLELGKIMPGDGEGSRVIVRIRDGSMPPPTSSVAAVPAASVGRIVAFIDGLPVPELEQPAD
jgi:hypothetical protein